MNQQDSQDFQVIKQELVQEIKGMRSDMNHLFETVHFHDQALYGDKINVPGAMEDLRILKSEYISRQKHIAWVWTAIIAGFVERAFHYLIGK